MGRKIAIVGGSRLTRDLAPYDDPEWEIWVLANQIDRYQGKKIDRVFEIHENLSEHGDIDAYWELVKSYAPGVPFVVSETHSDKGEVYPYEEAEKLLGGQHLTSSPAYMMVYALIEHELRDVEEVSDIGVYGIEMAVDDHEYFKQRPAMYAWIAFATAKGIKIHIPKESTLFKDKYCEGKHWNNVREDEGPFTVEQFEAMEQQHMEKIESLQDEIRTLEMQIAAHDGSRQIYTMLKQVARANETGAANLTLTKNAVVK